jgi:chemotaxis protein methyltransferase CheR
MPGSPILSEPLFERLSRIIYDASGIHLKEAKRQMVQSRLTVRLRALNLASFEDYVPFLDGNPTEMTEMLNRITTNKTFFFREPKHFETLRDVILPRIVNSSQHKSDRVIKAWCAASSTGEEPYSIAMVMAQFLAAHPSWSGKLLASDLDTNVLAKAKAATYPKRELSSIPNALGKKYALESTQGSDDAFRICPEIARQVQFRQINLMGGRYPISSKLDFIFCRNVFIYFTREDRDNVVRRFIDLLVPGGTLFLGHSEVLDVNDFNGCIKFVGNTSYQKISP